MRLADFHYDLPPELIAQEPLADRAASRMLVIDRASGTWKDLHFGDFPGFIRPGDCIVLNDSKVIPARLFGMRDDVAVEVFLVEALDDSDLVWNVLVQPGKRIRLGHRIQFEGAVAEVVDWGERGSRTVRFSEPALGVAARIGHMPLPPYIKREDRDLDRARYQTVFASRSGSIAAPTAGLHFTESILSQCRERGAEVATVTLHVGLGTFQPIDDTVVESRRLHGERYEITAESADRMASAGRLVCAGTTSVRTVESCSLETGGRLEPLQSTTNLFIQPGFQFRHTGAMLTNFHLPETSLLMLVAAFAGKDLTLAAYRHAVESRYRFFSYGDCMLLV